jgi:hypothetical protein
MTATSVLASCVKVSAMTGAVATGSAKRFSTM